MPLPGPRIKPLLEVPSDGVNGFPKAVSLGKITTLFAEADRFSFYSRTT
jgi:hypothetical protein